MSAVPGTVADVFTYLRTGALVGILTVMLGYAWRMRKLRNEEKSRDQDFQLEVSADGRTNLQFVIDNLVRNGERLEQEIEAQRATTAAADARHTKCQEELRGMREDYSGLRRQFIQFQMEHAKALPLGQRTPMLDELRQQLDALAAQENTVRPQS